MNELVRSFSTTGVFPYKALNNKRLLKMVIEKRLTPIHAVIIPTNRCNLHCKFCCCDDRDVGEELSLDNILCLLDKLKEYDTKAITLSGGGEPTLHPDFCKIIGEINKREMGIGLVSNGTKISILQTLLANSIEWIRISFGDGRDLYEAKDIVKNAEDLIRKDIVKYCGLSYVLTKDFDYELITFLCHYIEKSRIGYLKFVLDEGQDDILGYPQSIMELVNDKVIIAPMQYTEVKKQECPINLIKPIFAADGFVYPCCEIQYNNLSKERCYAKDRKVCTHDEYFEYITTQTSYYANNCRRCFHNTLREYLCSMKDEYYHIDWI